MKRRLIVGAIIMNEENKVLLCKMTTGLGVYPGQWGLVGGGVEEGELIEDALKREIREEVGLEVENVVSYWFHDEVKEKMYPDGSKGMVYMVYLLFDARAQGDVVLNQEWEEFAWVSIEELSSYELNAATIKTFAHKGWI